MLPRPGDVCEPSQRRNVPTGFQVAIECLGIRPGDQQSVVDNPEFTWGWQAGVDASLIHSLMPVETGPKEQADRLAWLSGFIAGQVARQLNYWSPFCNDEDHDCEMDCRDASNLLAKEDEAKKNTDPVLITENI